MSPALDLTPEERKELESLLAANRFESAHATSLNELVGQWTEFVGGMERGYEDSIYEYTNDLTVRDRLQRLVAASSPTLQAKLERAIAPVDERFAFATEPAVRPLRANPGDLPSWWRRVPKRRDGEFAEDLKAMGHVK
jgi:hypothetical protein